MFWRKELNFLNKSHSEQAYLVSRKQLPHTRSLADAKWNQSLVFYQPCRKTKVLTENYFEIILPSRLVYPALWLESEWILYLGGIVSDEGEVGHEDRVLGEGVLPHLGRRGRLVRQRAGRHSGQSLDLNERGLGEGEPGQVRHLEPLGVELPPDLLTALGLDIGIEAEVHQDPLECRGGGLGPGHEHVPQGDGEVLQGQGLVGLHADEVHVNVVPGTGVIQGVLMLLDLGHKVFFSLLKDLNLPSITSGCREELKQKTKY